MKPSKAYILKTDNEKSVQYAAVCAESCDNNGVEWEYVNWFSEGKAKDAWASIGIPIKNFDGYKAQNEKAQFATSGHAFIWKKIRDSNQAAYVFEHDAVLFYKADIDIPDNCIVTLGYKLQKIEQYDHAAAGPPQQIVDVNGKGHEGAHAYAITPETARLLLKEIETLGVRGMIDNTHFLRTRKTSVPIKIMCPTPAIGWLRESTIWKHSAYKNYEFIDSFKAHYVKN